MGPIEPLGKALQQLLHELCQIVHPVLHWGWRGDWAVREGDWKLIGSGEKPEFLGNLAEPEPERTNHLEQRPEFVRRLAGLHEAWTEKVRP